MSVIGCAVGIIGVVGLMLLMLTTSINRQFDSTSKSLERIHGRIDETNRRIDETNKRIDVVGRDIAELRDRTGALEGSLSTFMSERRQTDAA